MLKIICLPILFIIALGIPLQNENDFWFSKSPKVIGGESARIEDVPWQVALFYSGAFTCGGAIISENYILTAAHCTDNKTAKLFTINYGSDINTDGTPTYGVSIGQHPNFNYSLRDHDVSILKVSTPVQFSQQAQPIPLRLKEASQSENASISGWGITHSGDWFPPSDLYKVNLPIVARETCNVDYGGQITEGMVCAGIPNIGPCNGDSGGALTIDNVQVGIVSWGYGCAVEGFPGVFTNVVHFKDFIDENSNNEATWV